MPTHTFIKLYLYKIVLSQLIPYTNLYPRQEYYVAQGHKQGRATGS